MPVRFATVLVNILGVCLLACSVAAQAAEKRLDRTFSGRARRPADDRVGRHATCGSRAPRGNQVEVHILLKGSERTLERMTLTAEQSGNDVAVAAKHGTGKWTDFFGGWNLDGKIEVKVPRNYNIDIRTSGGDIIVGQLQGDARGKTSGGDIKVTEMHGPWKCRLPAATCGSSRSKATRGSTRRAATST